ncbi:MAG TPA: hypothetical protein VGK74_01820 [Symbiobacteriaceae bacterium]|jgi:hypothetical protein
MDHQRGTDPTPQGRTPHFVHHPKLSPPAGFEEGKYENSAPGPAVKEDGVYFFGYKRDEAYQPESAKEL